MAALEEDLFPDIEDEGFKLKLAHYITYGKAGHNLRSLKRTYQACYLTSIIYILIGMFYNLRPEEITSKIKRIYQYGNFQSEILNNIMGNNAVDITSIHISNTKQLDHVFENGIVLLGLVAQGEGGRHRYGMIYHYFLLKHHSDGRYSILSSYGSSYIAQRQQQTFVEPAIFDTFIDCLKNQTKTPDEKHVITDFMKKYFFDTQFNILQRKDESDLEDLYHGQEITQERRIKNQEEDVDREISSYLETSTQLMLFPHFIELLKIEELLLDLKDAKGKLSYQEYYKLYEELSVKPVELLEKMTQIKSTIEERKLEIPDSPILNNLTLKISALISQDTDGLDASAAFLTPLHVKDDSLRPPIKRNKEEAEISTEEEVKDEEREDLRQLVNTGLIRQPTEDERDNYASIHIDEKIEIIKKLVKSSRATTKEIMNEKVEAVGGRLKRKTRRQRKTMRKRKTKLKKKKLF